MKTAKFVFTLFTITAALLLAATSVKVAEAAETAGKRVNLTVSTELQVGDFTLTPGRYRVQHIERDSGHYIQFTAAHPRHAEPLGEAQCTLESKGRKARATRMTYRNVNGVETLVALQLKGEDTAHRF